MIVIIFKKILHQAGIEPGILPEEKELEGTTLPSRMVEVEIYGLYQTQIMTNIRNISENYKLHN